MVNLVYSYIVKQKMNNYVKTDHKKVYLVLIISTLLFIVYIFYPRSMDPNDNIQDSSIVSGAVTDIDGNVYNTIEIGNQVWMAENLRATRLNDGQRITYVPSDVAWGRLYSPGYCWPNNDTSNKEDYGALYNWYAVDTGKLAPDGWHVPTDDDWNVLADYLGGADVAGCKLKEMGFAFWAGDRVDDGSFVFFEEWEKYWTSTAGGWHPTDAWYHTITKLESRLGRSSHPKTVGHAVRCVKDD